jgi:hypothetical protein
MVIYLGNRARRRRRRKKSSHNILPRAIHSFFQWLLEEQKSRQLVAIACLATMLPPLYSHGQQQEEGRKRESKVLMGCWKRENYSCPGARFARYNLNRARMQQLLWSKQCVEKTIKCKKFSLHESKHRQNELLLFKFSTNDITNKYVPLPCLRPSFEYIMILMTFRVKEVSQCHSVSHLFNSTGCT